MCAASIATIGMPRWRSVTTDWSSRVLQPMSTTASIGATEMSVASPVSVSSNSASPAEPVSSVMPSSMAMFIGSRKASLSRSSITTPTIPERPRRRERARGSGPP